MQQKKPKSDQDKKTTHRIIHHIFYKYWRISLTGGILERKDVAQTSFVYKNIVRAYFYQYFNQYFKNKPKNA